jgi:hypothetical protein
MSWFDRFARQRDPAIGLDQAGLLDTGQHLGDATAEDIGDPQSR